MGFELMNTGFAEPEFPALSGIYGNPLGLKSTEKYASESRQWVEKELKFFLGEADQHPQGTRDPDASIAAIQPILPNAFELRRKGHNASLARGIRGGMTRQCIEEP